MVSRIKIDDIHTVHQIVDIDFNLSQILIQFE